MSPRAEATPLVNAAVPKLSPARALGAAVIATLCVLLVVELGGAAFYYLQHKQLVYLNHATPAPATPADEATYKQRLHPYFGFAGPYSATFRTSGATAYTNSLGFFQREPLALPFARSGNDFVVAVFGGSVAANLVQAPRGERRSARRCSGCRRSATAVSSSSTWRRARARSRNS